MNDDYTTRFIDGKPFVYRKCPSCGLAIHHDCECHDEDRSRMGLIPYVAVGLMTLFGVMMCVGQAKAEGWYDERRLEFTPTATLSDSRGTHVKPANIFEEGDVVHCILVNLGSGETVAKKTTILKYRRTVEFPYTRDAQGWCMQGNINNVAEVE